MFRFLNCADLFRRLLWCSGLERCLFIRNRGRVGHEEMGCNLWHSRSRLDARASLGAFASPCIYYRLPCTLADGLIGSPSWKCFHLLRFTSAEQRDSVGCDWRTISRASEEFKMTLIGPRLPRVRLRSLLPKRAKPCFVSLYKKEI